MTRVPGPYYDDVVDVVADPDFTASIAAKDWAIVGAHADVRRTPKQEPWPGQVIKFGQARYAEAEWLLASAERRSWGFICKKEESESFAIGRTFEVRRASRTWTATVTLNEPAASVRIAYTIQSGALRSRDFYRRGRLAGFAKPTPDGGATLYRFKDD